MPSFKAGSSKIFAANPPSLWPSNQSTVTALALSTLPKPQKPPLSLNLLTKSFQTINRAIFSAWALNRAIFSLAPCMAVILLTASPQPAKLATVRYIRHMAASIFVMPNTASNSLLLILIATVTVVKITQPPIYTISTRSTRSLAKPSLASIMNILSSKSAIESAKVSSTTPSKITWQIL